MILLNFEATIKPILYLRVRRLFTKPLQRVAYDDQQLVEACRRNDRRAQQELYERFKTPLYRLCLRYARDSQEAEDFLHEGFLVIFRDIHQYRGQGPLGGWLRRVALNVALQQLRRQHTAPFLDEANLSDLPDETDDTEDIPLPVLLAAINELPAGYRAVFNLYVVDQFTHQDIARELDISVGASKSQLFKAKAMLRRKLAANWPASTN